MYLKRSALCASVSLLLFLSLIFSVSPLTLHADEAKEKDSKETKTEEKQDQDAGAEPDDGIEPEVYAILEQMSDTLDSLEKFSFTADINFDAKLNSGQVVKVGGISNITVKRPNMVFAEFTGDRSDRKAWYNGKKLTIVSLRDGYYGQIETPDTIDATMDFLMTDYDFTLPLADIVHTNSYQAFTESALTGIALNDTKIGDKVCTHLAFVGEKIDWQIWVSTEEPKLPCKLVLTYKDKEMSPQYEAIFSDWNTAPEASDTLFTAQVPEDSVKIDFINIKANRGNE